VRRDWSKIASNTGKLILDKLLTDGKEMDDRVEEIFAILEELKEDLLAGRLPIPLLVITKQLTRNPNEYNEVNSLPHVQVALRMNITKNRRYKKGDMVDYVICEDGTDNAPVKRGYHLDELKGSETLKVDTNYYLSQQIHPVISRLLEPIEGIDSALIAMKLGLDPTKFRSTMKIQDEANDGESMIKSNAQKYRLCEKFMFNCVACKAVNYVAAAFKKEGNKLTSVFEKCLNPNCTVAPYQYSASINNQLLVTIHKNVQKFYENWFVCDNPLCNNNTQTHAWVSRDCTVALFALNLKVAL
jgi:DNA polymerase alpha subunit A